MPGSNHRAMVSAGATVPSRRCRIVHLGASNDARKNIHQRPRLVKLATTQPTIGRFTQRYTDIPLRVNSTTSEIARHRALIPVNGGSNLRM